MLSRLEVLIVKKCYELVDLPFTRYQSEQEAANMTWLPRLRELKVMGYPKQLSVPPVPWTPAACSPDIKRAGYGLEELYSSKGLSSSFLRIIGKDGQDGMF